MNLTYFINNYPTKHKIIIHDELFEMVRLGHKINLVVTHGAGNPLKEKVPFDIIYLQKKINLSYIINSLATSFLKSSRHLSLLIKNLGIKTALIYFSNYKKFGNPDRVHAHFANNAALKAMLFSKFKNIPFSCTGHGSEILLYPKPYLKDIILAAKPFITISKYNKEILEKKYSLPQDLIQVNYCGVDTQFFKPNRKNPPAIFTITSVTALKAIKGLEYLIIACEYLKNDGIVFNCEIIGGGNLFGKHQKMIKDLKLENHVKLLGAKSQEEIKNKLDNTSIFVLPSLSEGIPVAVMEAMSMKLPVIATEITGLPEIIKDQQTGFLVPPENARKLAQTIIFLYQHPEIIPKIGKEARISILENFNLEKNVIRFESLIS